MSSEYKLEDPGEGIREADILEIFVKEGDDVSEGDHVLDAETDKSAVAIHADFSGIVEEVKVEKGQTVKVGQVLLTYGDKAEGDEKRKQPEGGAAADAERAPDEERDRTDENVDDGKEEEADDGSESQDNGDSSEAAAGTSEGSESNDEKKKTKAAPSTRKLARDHRVEISELRGSGPSGRVLDEDVLQAAGQPASKVTPSSPTGRRSESSEEQERDSGSDQRAHGDSALTTGARVRGREKMSSVRRATARVMSRSFHEIPHVTHQDVVSIDELQALREKFSEQLDGDERPTLTAYLVKALAAALRSHPRFNVRLDAESQEIIHLESVHIGIAVATEGGLLVPVLRDADRLSLRQIARELRVISRRAHAGELSPSDMKGASSTVTNVGGIGGRSFTPIINPPEVSILGVGASYSAFVPRESDGAPEVTTLLPLSFSFDHRVNDGAGAAHFVNTVKSTLCSVGSFVLDA